MWFLDFIFTRYVHISLPKVKILIPVSYLWSSHVHIENINKQLPHACCATSLWYSQNKDDIFSYIFEVFCSACKSGNGNLYFDFFFSRIWLKDAIFYCPDISFENINCWLIIVMILNRPSTDKTVEQGYCLSELYEFEKENNEEWKMSINSFRQMIKITGRFSNLHQVNWIWIVIFFYTRYTYE